MTFGRLSAENAEHFAESLNDIFLSLLSLRVSHSGFCILGFANLVAISYLNSIHSLNTFKCDHRGCFFWRTFLNFLHIWQSTKPRPMSITFYVWSGMIGLKKYPLWFKNFNVSIPDGPQLFLCCNPDTFMLKSRSSRPIPVPMVDQFPLCTTNPRPIPNTFTLTTPNTAPTPDPYAQFTLSVSNT